MAYFTMKDFDFKGKRVLLRVDYNVPVNKQGEIEDDSRISESMPTVKYLIDKGSKLIVITSFGRPNGAVVENLRVDRIAQRMEKIVGKKVTKLNDCVGPEVENAVNAMKPGDIVFLENAEFYPGELEKDKAKRNEFAKKLAGFGDLFVNDGYAKSHRKNASMVGIPEYLPGCAGLLVEKELKAVQPLIKNPKHPYIAIIGGAKADKIDSIRELLPKVDMLIIGGMLANTFLKANGVDIKASKCDEASISAAKQILEANGRKIMLPVDAVAGDKFDAKAKSKVVQLANVPEGWLIMDIGPETAAIYCGALKDAKTVAWCGPIGVFEFDKFSAGTKAVAEELAKSRAFVFIGGGESADAVRKFGLAEKMGFISTGGGATLEMLQKGELPAIKALEENYKKFRK